MSWLFLDFKMTFSYGVLFCCLLISEYGFFYDVVVTKQYLALKVYIIYVAWFIMIKRAKIYRCDYVLAMLSYLRHYKLFSKCMYTKVISFNSFLFDSTNLKANAVLRSNPSEFHSSDFFFRGAAASSSFLQVFFIPLST